jgi:hypothetical protein
MKTSIKKDILDNFFSLPLDQFYSENNYRNLEDKLYKKSSINILNDTFMSLEFDKTDHCIYKCLTNSFIDETMAYPLLINKLSSDENFYFKKLRINKFLQNGLTLRIVSERKKIVNKFINYSKMKLEN